MTETINEFQRNEIKRMLEFGMRELFIVKLTGVNRETVRSLRKTVEFGSKRMLYKNGG